MSAERAELEREHSEALQGLEWERAERQRLENDLRKTIQSMGHQTDVRMLCLQFCLQYSCLYYHNKVMVIVQETDSYKQLNVEMIELKLQLENETRLKLQAERDLEAKYSELSESSIGSAEV